MAFLCAIPVVFTVGINALIFQHRQNDLLKDIQCILVCVAFHLKINMYSNHFQSILIRVSFQKIYIHTKNLHGGLDGEQMIFRISKSSSGWVLLGEYYHRNPYGYPGFLTETYSWLVDDKQ